MFLRRRWFASRPGVSLPGTHKKASTRGRSSSNWSQTGKLAGFNNVLVSKILCQGICLVRWWLMWRWTSTSRSRKTFWKYLRSTNGQIQNLIPNYTYDVVSDQMHNWVEQRPDFKSALRVVKMVLNTQCYQYLWLTMWFHAKKSKETLKKSKSLILQCKFGSRAQKWPKIAKKTDHSIAIYSIFCIGMVYFGCLSVSPHIQVVHQNMCGKGG